MLDPARAANRDDLPWLRHRARPRQPAPPTANGGGIRYVHDRPRPRRSPAPTTAPAPSAPLDLDRPATSAPISFDRAPKPASPDRPAASASLDLDQPATPPTPTTPAPHTTPAPPTTPATPPPAPPTDQPARRAAVERVRAGQRRILTEEEPTVTLSRVQSGIGTLTIDAAVPAASRLQIGALFELADGQASTVDLGAGRRVAPSPPHAPVLVARRERFEQVAVDLRRCRELRRLAIYGLSPSMQWSGTLVLTTFGGGRVEVPLEPLETAGSAVLVTAYNVRGELVIRAELTPVAGVRDAARAFGYDRITWLDDRNPVA